MGAPLPNRIGRYEIVNRLGRGGMGVVYLATDPALGRTVAIKMLTEDNEELRERFAREARSAAALSHNNIVTIYDVGEDVGRPFIAMEYLDGETLAEMVRRRAPVPLGRKLQLMMELCAGLGYAHRSGIVHRDIKPANLMITTEGTLKILDFGIARVTADATSAGLTRIGTVMGSTHYMSPEQAEGRPVDERSDIFSVGLVLYELLSLQRAFPGDNAHVVLNMILHAEPRPIRELEPAVDEELERTVNKGLAKNPAERYQTLSAMSADLVRAQQRLQDGGGGTAQLDRGRTGGRPGTSDGSQTPRSGGTPASGAPPRSGGTPASGPRNIPNLEAIANRRKEQIESHLREALAHLKAERYEDAIAQCEQAVLLNPDEVRALEMLHDAHRALESRRVRQWLAEAQVLIQQGSLTEAEGLIGQSLQLQPDSAEAQASLLDLKDRRRERERTAERTRSVRSALSRARTNMEAGAFEAVLRSASEALAYDPADDEALRLIRDAREAIEERDRRQEHEQRAIEAVSRARQLASAADIDGALIFLRAFTPPHQLVTEAIVEIQRAGDEVQRRQDEERAAEEEGRREGQAEETRWIEATGETLVLTREPAPVSQDPGRVARADDETKSASAPEVMPAIEVPAETETLRREAAVDRSQWYRKPALMMPAAVLAVGLIAGGWWVWGASQGGRPESKKPVPSPSPVDYAPILADARTQESNALSAIVLIRKIPANAPEYQGAQALLTRIRTSAANNAAVARRAAEKAGATGQAIFRDGDRQFREAAGLDNADAAVSLYAQAQQSFTQAAAAGLTPEQLVQLAREAHGNKKIPGAIAYALSALAKDPNSQSAVRVLEGIRKDAARLAGEARDKAASAGATVVNSGNFKLAQSKDQVASNLTSPAVTQSAVDTYRDAQVAYEAAYSEVHNSTVALATEVRMIGQRFERAMGGDDLTAAQAEFDNLRNRDPNNRLLSEWDKRVKDLVKKIDETRTTALDKKEALTLLEEARRMTDRVEAIKKLEKARALAPDNRDVQAELDRLKTMPKPTPSGVGGGISTPPPAKTPEAAIMDVLHALAAAYNKKSIGEIRNIWPSVPKDYDSGWNSLVRSQQWIFDEGTPPTIVVTGTEATATCRVLMKADTTRGPVESKPVLVIQLRKQPNGWEIVSSRATSTWR